MFNKRYIYISIAVLLILLIGKKVSALNLIKQFEGLKLISYPDTGGVYTIGFGNTKNKDTGQAIRPGDKIDLATAERWLKIDVDQRIKFIKPLIKVPITANMMAAMTSLAYNIGLQAFKDSKLLEKLNAGVDKKIVANEFLKWNKAGGVVVNGLTIRRNKEADLYFKK